MLHRSESTVIGHGIHGIQVIKTGVKNTVVSEWGY